jgi:hypothetical protein
MVTISVTPKTVAHGKPVMIKVAARNDSSTQQQFFLKTSVSKWTRRFLWVYYWKTMQSWAAVKLLPRQSITKEYKYTPPNAANYKADAGLYDTVGRQRESASARFTAT